MYVIQLTSETWISVDEHGDRCETHDLDTALIFENIYDAAKYAGFYGGAVAICSVERERLHLADLKAFARECRDNWDCDADAHTYSTLCRACEAARLCPTE